MAKRVYSIVFVLFIAVSNLVSVNTVQAKEKSDVRDEIELLSRLGDIPARYTAAKEKSDVRDEIELLSRLGDIPARYTVENIND